MDGKARGTLIYGIINSLLPILIVLVKQGIFGAAENAWKFIYLAIAMAVVPILSSLVGIVIAGIRLKKAPEAATKIGLVLSCVGLVMQFVFRFVLML